MTHQLPFAITSDRLVPSWLGNFSFCAPTAAPHIYGVRLRRGRGCMEKARLDDLHCRVVGWYVLTGVCSRDHHQCWALGRSHRRRCNPATLRTAPSNSPSLSPWKCFTLPHDCAYPSTSRSLTSRPQHVLPCSKCLMKCSFRTNTKNVVGMEFVVPMEMEREVQNVHVKSKFVFS